MCVLNMPQAKKTFSDTFSIIYPQTMKLTKETTEKFVCVLITFRDKKPTEEKTLILLCGWATKDHHRRKAGPKRSDSSVRRHRYKPCIAVFSSNSQLKLIAILSVQFKMWQIKYLGL